LPRGRRGRVAFAQRSGLLPALKRLVDPATLGDPMQPLIWVSKSLEKLAAALTEVGHPIGPDTVRKDFSEDPLLAPVQSEGRRGIAPPRPQYQFEYINTSVVAAQARQAARSRPSGVARVLRNWPA
jgi:hypothetical protein